MQLEEIQRRLDGILKDLTRKSFHHDARRLQNLVEFRLHPQEQERRLAERLQSAASGEDFGQDLRDYTLLLDPPDAALPDFPGIQRYTPEYYQELAEWKAEQQNNRRSLEPCIEITDWLRTLQAPGDDNAVHAIERWEKTHSQARLFAALVRVDPLDPRVSELLRGAEQVNANSAGFIAINYYRARLLRLSGYAAAARELLSNVLDARRNIPISAHNLLQDEQLKVAADVQGFSKLLARQPATMSIEYPHPEARSGCYTQGCNIVFYGVKQATAHSRLLPQFDETAASLLNNRVDLETFAAVVQSGGLPRNLQDAVAPASWARAALLDKPETAKQVRELAVLARPELKPYIEQYESAATPEERNFAGAFLIAHFPGLRPNVDDELLVPPTSRGLTAIATTGGAGTLAPSNRVRAHHPCRPNEKKKNSCRNFHFQPSCLTHGSSAQSQRYASCCDWENRQIICLRS